MSATNLFDYLGLAPALPGARCRRKHALFDEAQPGEAPETVQQRHAQALSLCLRECPARERCETWYLGLKPSSRPTGVVAGQVWENGKPKSERPPGRPRKAAG
jgi:hypothetical protein